MRGEQFVLDDHQVVDRVQAALAQRAVARLGRVRDQRHQVPAVRWYADAAASAMRPVAKRNSTRLVTQILAARRARRYGALRAR